jgi:iron uptake system EfeUOB component EfeO/EfeM
VLLRDLAAVPGSRRLTSKVGVAAVCLTAAAALVVLGLTGAFSSSGTARPCSSYPSPGSPAPAGAKLPSALAARYALWSSPQRAVDRLRPQQVASLNASGLIMSQTRFLGDTAAGGRIFVIPAEHLLALPLAPARCLSAVQRVIERESRPQLRAEYRQAGLCLLVLYARGAAQDLKDCAPATGTPYTLLSADGTPGFGLVPNGVDAVTVSYWAAPPRTVAVRDNSFVIVAPSQNALPCGVQWLDPTGNVRKIALGCSYLTIERPAFAAYRAYVAGKLVAVRAQVAVLSAAIAAGNLARARSAWLTAHLTWLEIGQDDGAYGCFGALGAAIDGLAAGHRLGTADPGFTGFHRIEFDLWTQRSLSAAARATATLEHLLARLTRAPLSAYLPSTPTGIGNWLLRPHEVLEDALRDSLTANDDYGSGSDLASLRADVTAVRRLLSELRPALDPVAPHLVSDANAELDALTAAIDATHAGGAGTPIAGLPVRQREQVDADVGAALETLAPIPDLLTSTGSNAPSA